MKKVVDQKTLMIGSSSFIGRYLSDLYQGELIPTYYNNKVKNGVKFDIAKDDITSILEKFNVNEVLLIGGIVNFNEIKNNIDYATLINVINMKRIIREISSFGAKITFFSSESVFDGNKGNYSETSIPKPKFIYGDHKYQIEKYIQDITDKHLIFRIAKVFSSNPKEKTLITNWLKQLLANETILVAEDNVFSPIYVKDCVLIIKKLISQNETGIFNICSDEQLSRLKMLQFVMHEFRRYSNFNGEIKLMNLNDIQGAEKLPLNTSLNYNKTYEHTKIKPIKFKEICKEIVNNHFNNNEK